MSEFQLHWRTLGLLRWWTIRGRANRTLRLAKNPRYALGLLAGIAYFGWFVGRPTFFGGGEVETLNFGGAVSEGAQLLVAALMGLYITVTWLSSRRNPLIKLKSEDFHMLLPAPLPRRTVLSYILLQQFPKLILIALILGLVMSSSGSPVEQARHTLSLMLFFIAWDVYGKCRSIFKQRLWERSPLLVAATQVLAVFWAVAIVLSLRVGVLNLLRTWQTEPPKGKEAWIELFSQLPSDVLQSPLAWTLKPFWFLASARLSQEPLLAVASALTGIGLTAALFFLLVWANPGFNEAQVVSSASRGDKRTEKYQRQSFRLRRAVPFTLAPTGRPELALWWKHLLSGFRLRLLWLSGGLVLLLATVMAVVAALDAPRGLTGFLVGTGTILGFTLPFFAGISGNSGFVKDLRHLEAVRTWPVPPRRMALGQSLHSASLGFLGSVAAFLIAFSTHTAVRITGSETSLSPLPNGFLEGFGVDPTFALFLLMLSVLPFLASVSLLSSQLEGVTGLFLPGWLMMGERRRGDPAAFGTRVIYGIAFFFALGIGLIPTGLMILGYVFLVHGGWSPGIWAYPLMGTLLAVPLFLEALGMVVLGGRLWQRMDPAEEVLEGFE